MWLYPLQVLAACEAYNFYHRAVLLAACTLSIVLKDDSGTLSRPKKRKKKNKISMNHYRNVKNNFIRQENKYIEKYTCTRPALSIGRLLLGLG